MASINRNVSEMGAPDPRSQNVSGAVAGMASPAADKGLEAFLKKLEGGEYSVREAFLMATSFVDGIGYDMDSDHMPWFYKVYRDGVEFIWPSGLLMRIVIDPLTGKIVAIFDHLARTEVIE